jgi:hypothetical protein
MEVLGAWSYQVKPDALNQRQWPHLLNFAKQFFPVGVRAKLVVEKLSRRL